MENPFRHILKGKVVILGIGQVLKGDDGLGPWLIERIQGKIPALCFDAGPAPENYLGKIVREAPDTVLLIDACELGQEPGAFVVMPKEDLVQSGFTTHDLSPRVLIEYLEKQSRADIYLLGVQPRSVGFGDDLSPEVQRALEQLERLLKEAFHA